MKKAMRLVWFFGVWATACLAQDSDKTREFGRYCYLYYDRYSCTDAGCFWDEAGHYCYHG